MGLDAATGKALTSAAGEAESRLATATDASFQVRWKEGRPIEKPFLNTSPTIGTQLPTDITPM